ncbi:PEP-CTERM sorting domain-containing protein [Nostoc punctiforme]|uniref:PEP-CTERM sorting domain-containing protein n=1 Tax=Nostoc punctiforme TaxID=272131 RepID=UPI0037CB56E8
MGVLASFGGSSAVAGVGLALGFGTLLRRTEANSGALIFSEGCVGCSCGADVSGSEEVSFSDKSLLRTEIGSPAFSCVGGTGCSLWDKSSVGFSFTGGTIAAGCGGV